MIEAGFTASGTTGCVQVSYGTLNNWARMGILGPSIREAAGAGRGRERRYSREDLIILKHLATLRRYGVGLKNWPAYIRFLRNTSLGALNWITLWGDGSVIPTDEPENALALSPGPRYRGCIILPTRALVNEVDNWINGQREPRE
jgi:DNA-binding transcriptional MerR regulator